MDEGSEGTAPEWQRAPAELVRTFNELVSPLPGVELRKLFGYPAAYFQGQMFASLFRDRVTLRLAAEDRARFMTIEGAAPFEPMAGRPMREYVVVPPTLMAQPAELASWLDRALAYAASLPPKEPKKRKKSSKQ